MTRRLLVAIAAMAALLAIPSLASATIAFNKTIKQPSNGNEAIYVANDDGTGARALDVTGLYPMISPNGKMIAYTYISNLKDWTQELRFVDIATGVMVDTNLACTGPQWAPNSSAVACSITRFAKGDLKGMGLNVVTPTGASTILLPANGAALNGWSWSPDSTKVVWGQMGLDSKSSTAVLRWLNADGSGAVGKLGAGAQPVWGPSRIAFTRSTHAIAGGTAVLRSQIWTLDPAAGASSAEQLTTYRAKGLVEGPQPFQWTPDGSRIVGTLVGEDYVQPIYVNATTGRIRDFGPTNAMPQAVSADGTQALVVANLLGGKTQVVYVSPLAKMASSLLLKDADTVSASANWQP